MWGGGLLGFFVVVCFGGFCRGDWGYLFIFFLFVCCGHICSLANKLMCTLQLHASSFRNRGFDLSTSSTNLSTSPACGSPDAGSPTSLKGRVGGCMCGGGGGG